MRQLLKAVTPFFSSRLVQKLKNTSMNKKEMLCWLQSTPAKSFSKCVQPSSALLKCRQVPGESVISIRWHFLRCVSGLNGFRFASFNGHLFFSKGKYVVWLPLHSNKCSIYMFKYYKSSFSAWGNLKSEPWKNEKKRCVLKVIYNIALTMLSHLSDFKSISSHMPGLSICSVLHLHFVLLIPYKCARRIYFIDWDVENSCWCIWLKFIFFLLLCLGTVFLSGRKAMISCKFSKVTATKSKWAYSQVRFAGKICMIVAKTSFFLSL